MARKISYGQFCPVAKACEIIAERWTPLILREVLCGAHRFSDIHRGVPQMSRSLLSKRLDELERAGVILRADSPSGHPEYHATPAGLELRPIVVQIGNWGKQWTRSSLGPEDLDAGLLMWDMRRRIDHTQVPDRRVVVQFEYHDAPIHRRGWWLVLEDGQSDLCLTDPGFEPDLYVKSDVATMTGIWLGDVSYGAAVQSGRLTLEGSPEIRAHFPRLLQLSIFADIERRAG